MARSQGRGNSVKGKKVLLSKLMTFTRIDRVFLRFQTSNLTVFNFHRIREDKPSGPFWFDDEVFNSTVSQFRNHVKWIKNNTNIISEEQLIQSLRKKEPLPPYSTMITFDDGYIDNFTLAYPILKEFQVPAIYFIPTEAIDERKLGWWDLITYVVKKTDRPDIAVDRAAARAHALQKMKFGNAAENAAFVEKFARKCGVELPSREVCSAELMTWDQVKTVAQNGITIGSHTHTQRVLATLNTAEQIEEFRNSKVALETKLGVKIRSLAYPVGGYEHFTLESKKLARECGYEVAFSFTHEINDAEHIDPYNIRRLVPPEELSLYVGAMSWPGAFARRRSLTKSENQV
jgi:peptidoglycan/xylan/chitin deacetylase (PgdA/CDA1 family)